MLERKLQIPKPQTYLISDANRMLLEYIDAESEEGNNINALLRGPSGCGKSELVNQYAATRQRPLAVLEVGRLSEASQIFGSQTLESGTITFQPGLFLVAIQTPNCVIHLQELNRAESDKALNAIFSVLDETFRAIWLDELQELIQVAPGVTFFATINEGYQFMGTMPVDEALANRFSINMELGYLPPAQETIILTTRAGINHDDAVSLVGVANTLRTAKENSIHVSIRQVLAMGKMVKRGVPLQLALKTVLPSAGMEALEKILLAIQLSGGNRTSITRESQGIEDSINQYGVM